MEYRSKTYSLSDEVIARIDVLRGRYGSVNKALLAVLPTVAVIEHGGEQLPATYTTAITEAGMRAGDPESPIRQHMGEIARHVVVPTPRPFKGPLLKPKERGK